MNIRIFQKIGLITLASAALCTSANALTSGPPAIKKGSTSAPSEYTVQRGISDDDFQFGGRLEAAYTMARKALAEGDKANGLKLMRLVADAGHVLAMHDMAIFLRQENTKETMAEAAIWYRRASEWRGFGFGGSQNNLGDMYETGEGLPKSPGDAIYWYTRSALQGEPTAYLSLGSCFADGVGVRKDPVEAYFWLSLAARDLGDGSNRSSALSQLKELEKALSANQVAEAKSKAEQFRPYYQTKLTIGDPLERTNPESPAQGSK
jgi:TPR repeat protein